jgi:hypothetical protein
MIQNTYMVQDKVTLTAKQRRDLCVLNCKLFTTLTGQPVRPQDFEAMFEAEAELLLNYNMFLLIALCKKLKA